jgi:dipeptidyl aminopeptidase/acylaminoacyl peptidase
LTPDGKWLVYLLRPQGSGEGSVIVRSTSGAEQRIYSAGRILQNADGTSALKMSPSGRWIAYFQGETVREGSEAEQTPAERSQTPGHGKTLILLETTRGVAAQFSNVQSFAFNAEAGTSASSDWLAVHHDDAAGKRLALRELGTDRSTDLAGVQEFAFNAPGSRLAWIDGAGVHAYSLRSRATTDLDVSGGARKALTWSPAGNALALFRDCDERTDEGAGRRGDACSILAFSGLDGPSLSRFVLQPKSWASFPRGFEISTDATRYPYVVRAPLMWREDERGLFFGVRHVRADTAVPSGDGVVIWRSSDVLLPSTERAIAADEQFSYLSFADLKSRRFVRLADEGIPEVEPHGRARSLLGFVSEPYDREYSLTGHRHRDYYLIDIETGERSLLVRKLALPLNWTIAPDPMLSPDGAFVVYLEGSDYISFNVSRKTRRNLTAGVSSTRFVEPVDLRSRVRQFLYPFPVFRGWGDGGRSILISDHYDIWSLPLGDADAVNLTVNGKRDGLIYIPTQLASAGENPSGEYADMRSESLSLADLYFRVLDSRTLRTGLARRTHRAAVPEILRWDDADVRYQKARRAETVVCTLQTAIVFPDYHVVSKDWRRLTRLTDANPQQARESWSPGARLVQYKTANGDELRGVLHLPAGYVDGHRYPTIVSIYLLQSDRLHHYRPPSIDGGMLVTDDIPRWTRAGYAVLEPDIQPRLNEPVKAALDSVLAAVRAGTETGVVDESRMALEGHSYGAYETGAIVTRTNIFRAAVPLSGLMNLISTYGTVYELWSGRRVPMSFTNESDQVFIAGPWWEHWHAFIENSSLFRVRDVTTPLLIVHGDKDTGASFLQSVEFFNNLRRAGKTEVALLQYRNEPHTFTDARLLADLTRRKQQFYDYLLKDGPPPIWWKAAGKPLVSQNDPFAGSPSEPHPQQR